ncbi:MAG: DNA-binding protein [Verrucomicrobia bacterium]|nr:DNA-binding protein [Verrucomicrobiota bacterium]
MKHHRLAAFNRSVSLILGLTLGSLVVAWITLAQNPPAKPTTRAAGSIKKVHRLGLGPGDLLLESIRHFIREHGINDGAVLTGIGSLSECRIHWPAKPEYPPQNVFQTFKGSLEIAGIQGIIADGEPHLHLIVAERGEARSIGGHLEDGSKVLYLAEITIAEFDGPPMTRRPNQHNVRMLQVK